MLFVAIVNGDASLIFVSVHLSSIYMRVTDSFEFIVYPATLLKVFISEGVPW